MAAGLGRCCWLRTAEIWILTKIPVGIEFVRTSEGTLNRWLQSRLMENYVCRACGGLVAPDRQSAHELYWYQPPQVFRCSGDTLV